MLILLIFAFIGGIVTILSPCILPILPIVLSGSLTGGKKRPLGIVLGFILSFTFFTLFLTALVKVFGLPADVLRTLAVVIIGFFGISLFIPQTTIFLEQLFSKLSSRLPQSNTQDTGFLGGILVGLSLGLIWTPCVGPILAAIITLAATSTITLGAVFITVSYSLGTAIPLLAITYGGRQLLQKNTWLLQNSAKIQKAFGILMILTAIGIFFNIDRRFQAYILQKFPQYGVGLTSLEDNTFVKAALEQFKRGEEINLLPNPQTTAPEIIAGGDWFNSEPLQISQLRGKVVLIDFWTYTCINCIRTLPYLSSWHEKYKDQGLVIIGVHTPEFAFERQSQNVAQAIADYEITYPVVQDNDYATWNAYQNRYWPAKYLLDAQGRVRYTHFGEGKYDETEQMIQKLLQEAGNQVSLPLDTASESIAYRQLSPETYLGSARMELLHPHGRIRNGTYALTLEPDLPVSRFSLGGNWYITDEYSESGAQSVLEYNFSAKNVYLVMNLEAAGSKQLRVYLDGQLVAPTQAGADVSRGMVTVDENRLYELINLNAVENHRLRLEFDSGIQIYAFTFG